MLRPAAKFAIATWVSAAGLVVIFAAFWRLAYVPPHAAWALVTTASVVADRGCFNGHLCRTTAPSRGRAYGSARLATRRALQTRAKSPWNVLPTEPQRGSSTNLKTARSTVWSRTPRL